MSDTLQSSSLKEILDHQINDLPNDIALCLSGGIDSIALFSLLLEHGKKINVYSFAFDESSHDFIIARSLADKAKCHFTPIFLPRDIETLKNDVLTLHKDYGCVKKTEYECVWPFLYVYPCIKESVIVTGLGSEGHFGTTKKASIHFKNDLDSFRREFFSNPNVSQKNQHEALCKNFHIASWFPFLTKEVFDWSLGKTYDEINKPKLKQPLIDMITFDIRPKPSNLQCGSGIREHFDELLTTSWNRHNYKSVVGVLNEINKGAKFNAVWELI